MSLSEHSNMGLGDMYDSMIAILSNIDAAEVFLLAVDCDGEAMIRILWVGGMMTQAKIPQEEMATANFDILHETVNKMEQQFIKWEVGED